MQRLFIGDVQGCAEELDLLLERAKAAFSDDFELWVVGDLVNRGPDNLSPLERVRELVDAGRGRYVLGNHEIHLISVALGVRELSKNDSINDVLDRNDASEWIEWLRTRPLVESGEIAGQAFAMLHASVAPTWSLSELTRRGDAVHDRLAGELEDVRTFLAADPEADPVRSDLARLTRGRMADERCWSSEEPESPDGAWHVAWSRQDHDYGIVYGHWARQGLHVAPGLRGLDTGCVHHGRGRDGFLTAWLPEEEGPEGRAFDVPDDRFWRIPAQRRYYYPTHDPS